MDEWINKSNNAPMRMKCPLNEGELIEIKTSDYRLPVNLCFY